MQGRRLSAPASRSLLSSRTCVSTLASKIPNLSAVISFIVPLFNCLDYTKAMLASLQASLPDKLEHEIIMVDDGSTDGTREWLATLEEPIRVVLNEKNMGYGASNNAAARVAVGDLLVLLNNDLILAPGWLEPLLSVHRSLGEEAGIVGNVQVDAATGETDHAGITFSLKGKPEHIRAVPKGERLRRVDAVTGACMLVDAELWTRLGGFDPAFVNGCEDVDLCLRARSAGQVNAIALGSVVRHHISRSPGRKLRDEENTYRLVQRWRSDIVTLATRNWCRHCVDTWFHDRGRCPAPEAALQAGLFLLGLRSTPPAIATREMQAAVDVELKRWAEMFARRPM